MVFYDTYHSYTARKKIVTVPLGVWLAEEGSKGAISYSPALTPKTTRCKTNGF
jgi:hypothetical protein